MHEAEIDNTKLRLDNFQTKRKLNLMGFVFLFETQSENVSKPL